MQKIKGSVEVPNVGSVTVATVPDGVVSDASGDRRFRVELEYRGRRMRARAWGTGARLEPEDALGVIAADAGVGVVEIADVTGDDRTAAALWAWEIASMRRVFASEFENVVQWGRAWAWP